MKIFNNTSSEWILRIPPALTSILLVFLTYSLVKIITKKGERAFLASLVTVSMPFILKEGIVNSWDIFSYVYAFGFICFILKAIKNNTNEISNYIISAFFLGFSIMSKGPVALYGIVLPFFIAYLIAFGTKEFKGKIKKIFLVIVLGVIIGLSWYIYMLILHRELFISVMNKEIGTWDSRSVKGFFFYFNSLYSVGLWFLFILASYFIPWLKIKNDNRESICLKDKREYKFSFIWIILSLLLISFIKMKKDRYAIPIFIISPIFISTILTYYCEDKTIKIVENFKDIFNKNNKLHKVDRINSFIFYTQFLVLLIVTSIFPFLYLVRGYIVKYCGLSSTILYFLISFILLWIIIKKFNKKNSEEITYNTKFKELIILTSIVGIFSFSIKYRLIEFSKMKKHRENIANLNILCFEKKLLNIYSQEAYINHVWESGHKIRKELNNLPESFIYIVVVEEMKKSGLTLEEFINSKVELANYEIIEKKEIYTFKSGSSKDILIYMKKK